MRDARDADAAGSRNVRPRGQDVAEGRVAIAAGTRLGPSALGVLASIGWIDAPVVRRPRVAIVSSGDELLQPGDVEGVRAGRGIIASNALVLAALVREAGGVPVDLGVATDDPAAVHERLLAARAHDCDVVLTTGGISVGAHDHVREAVGLAGGRVRFWRVRMRPGGPVAYGTLPGAHDDVPWLGLPGNPVSTVVTFELFARPLLRRLSGDARPFRTAQRVTVDDDVRTPAALAHFLRVALTSDADGTLRARLTGPQGSGLLTSAARADALLIVPEHVDALAPGDGAHAMLLAEPSRADFDWPGTALLPSLPPRS